MMISCVNSLLAAFYYGNITYLSHNPPKMGFLSTVPQDVALQLVSAVATVKMGNNLPPPSLPFSLLLPAPSLQFYRKWHQAEPSNPPGRHLTAYLWPHLRLCNADGVFVGIKERCVADKGVVGVVGVVGVLQLWS